MKIESKGITLIALVITIVVMLVLAGIVISLTLGENGIIKKSKEAGVEYIKAEIKQEIEFAILEIETDLKISNTQEDLTNELIVNSIPNKLEDILINGDLTGEYREYEYWIDEEYKVHIGEKSNNPVKVKLTIEKLGTSTCTVKVEASSTKGNIVMYHYKINNQISEQINQSEYMVENLEPNTEYTISVIAIDEQGNRKESIPVTVTTKERTYIIKDGVEQIEGNLGYTTMTQENGYLKLDLDSTTQRAGYYFFYDLTKYKEVKIDTEVTNKEISNSGCYIRMKIFNSEPYIEEIVKEVAITSFTETEKPRAVYSMAIEEFTGEYGIGYMKNATGSQVKASLNIYNLWLEE